METGSFEPNEGHTCAKRKLDDHLILVSPLGRGQGLPYAPVDWPSPGDIWGWRVGSRISKKGVYQDRCLVAPWSLQERPKKKIMFRSKLSVEHYIRSKFPDADIDDFFASFTWDIAATTSSQGIGYLRFNSIYIYAPLLVIRCCSVIIYLFVKRIFLEYSIFALA